jgi:hypothetical protein
MKTKQKKKTYTVRIEWPVTYYCDTVVKAIDPNDAARIAMEDPDYDSQDSYDEPGDSTVEGVCEGDEYDFMQRIDAGDGTSEAAREHGPELLDALRSVMTLAHSHFLLKGKTASSSDFATFNQAKQLIELLTNGNP